MTYLPNIPQPNDNLDFSQGQLLGNYLQLDTRFSVDHYAFSNNGGNSGKHNQVTTPARVGGHPTPASGQPVFYATQDSANLGVLQYTRYFAAAPVAPTPLSSLQSTVSGIVLASNTTLPIFDFATAPRCYGEYWIYDTTNATIPIVVLFGFTGATLSVQPTGGNVYQTQSSGSILQVRNISLNPVTFYWTIKFTRIG